MIPPAASPTVAAPVSYVIPVFNGAAFIADAVRSLIEQTWRPAEVIVVDDGSTDATAEIVRGLAAESAAAAANPGAAPERTGPTAPTVDVRLIQQPNAGTGAALNTGIAASTQPLIGIMGADDQARPERTAVQVELLNAHPEVGLVFGDGTICHPAPPSETAATTGPRGMVRTATKFSDEVRFGRGWVFGRLLRKNFIPAPAVMVRWSALERVGGHNPDVFHEDWDLWLRLCRMYPVEYSLVPVIDYRRHPHARSARLLRRVKHRAWIWLRALLGAYSLAAVRRDAERFRLVRTGTGADAPR